MTEELRIEGVRVEHSAPAGHDTYDQRPPLLLVHGAYHGSWCWENYLSYFSNAGWDTLALNWYGRGGSRDLAPEVLMNRSVADLTEEISCPVLVIGGEMDMVCPAEIARKLAAHYDAEYIFLPGRGHSMLVEPRWREAAGQIADWLGRLITPAGSEATAPTDREQK